MRKNIHHKKYILLTVFLCALYLISCFDNPHDNINDPENPNYDGIVSIEITPANLSIAQNTTQQFIAIATNSDSSTQNITNYAAWRSSDTNTATIDTTGLVTGIAAGQTIITASMSGFTSPGVILTITDAELLSIDVKPVNPSIALGLTQQFVATGNYSDSTNSILTNVVTWNSSLNGVATISTAGLATSQNIGVTIITAELNGVTSPDISLTITAVELVSIAVTPATPGDLLISNTQQFTAEGTYTDSNNSNITSAVTWDSSDTAVASIDSTGLATGMTVGQTTITASLSEINSPDITLTVISGIKDHLVVAGSKYDDVEGDMDISLRIYESDGAVYLSETLFDGADDLNYENESPNDIAVDQANGIYIVGRQGNAGGPTNQRFIFLKYKTNGEKLWEKIDASNNSVANGVAVDLDGNIYVVGASSNNLFVKKYDSSGTEITTGWDKSLDKGINGGGAQSVAIDNNNNVIIVGSFADGYPASSWWKLMFDSSGNILHNVKLPAVDYSTATTVGVNPNDETIFIAGNEKDANDINWIIRKYSSDLTTEDDSNDWGNHIPDNAVHDRVYDLAFDDSGNIFAAGYGDTVSPISWLIMKYSYDGNLQHTATYSPGTSENVIHSIVIDSLNRVYAVGYRDSGGTRDCVIKRYNNSDLSVDNDFSEIVLSNVATTAVSFAAEVLN